MRRLFAGVAMITFSTLLLEILLTRIFSYTLYYHFAFLVISVALFGLGAAGVMLYVRAGDYPPEKLEEKLAHHALRFALWTCVALVYVLYNGVSARLDIFHRPQFSAQTFFELALLYGVAAVPMFHSGMVVSLAITHLRERIGELYFFDLAGAALGCLAAGPLLERLGAENAVLLVAAISAGAALVFRPRPAEGRIPWGAAALTAALLLAIVANLARPTLRVGSFKEVDESFVTFSKWNSFSRIVVEERPGQRPGLYIDAMAKTEIHSSAEVDLPEAPPDEYSGVSGLGYAVRQDGKALIIGPGGGLDVVHALRARNRVTAVEINPIIVRDVMQERFREHSGGLYLRPDVRVVVDEGRSFVRRSPERYDVIQATMVDTWAATASGAFALTENYLYTVEAFEDYLRHLDDDGILSVTRWCIPPDMECVRVLTVAREALRRVGVADADRHVYFAWRHPIGNALIRRTPFPPGEVEALDGAVESRGMQVLYRPGQERQDTIAQLVRAPDPWPTIRAFPADISPTYDDRPFFFYGVRPGDLVAALGDMEWLMLNSFSVAVLLALFLLVTVLVVVFLVGPMVVHRREALRHRPLSKIRDLSFFIGIGVGFIVVEIALLQRFSLFLGHPSHSLVVVLFSLLLAGSAGAFLSDRIPERHRRTALSAAAATIAVVTIAYVSLLPWVFGRWIGSPLDTRIALSVLLVAIPGVVMGMMLPTGVRLVSTRHPEIIPWGWGLNGAASVFGSVAAMVLAMNAGARWTLLAGGACYLLALAAGARAPGTVSAGGAPEPPADPPETALAPAAEAEAMAEPPPRNGPGLDERPAGGKTSGA